MRHEGLRSAAALPPVASGTPGLRLRAAVPAIEAFAADHGGHEELTLEASPGVYHLLGPVESAKAGPCPPRPS